MNKRILAAITAASMVMTCAGAETTKKERVYVVTNAAGELQSATDIVLLENTDGLETLEDCSGLTGIENVSGHETFTVDGNAVIWNANGNDIRYQGKSEQLPAVVPVVTCELDGTSVDPAQLADKSGRLTIRVNCTLNGNAPVLALTAMVVPENMKNIELENAVMLDEGGKQLIVGYTLPGADPMLELSDHFTITCDVDHANLSWMMTVASTDPIAVLCDKAADRVSDAGKLTDTMTGILQALKNGTDLPEVGEDLKPVTEGLTKLLSGVDALADGAASVNTGAATLSAGVTQLAAGATKLSEGATALDTGAATLETGLTTLTANNEALNNGAAQLFAAILSTANQQLAASGLDAAGVKLPALTAENYATVLDTAVTQLNTMMEQGKTAAEAQVRTAVKAQEATIQEAITQTVKGKVLTSVLSAAGLTMTAEEYEAAVKAKKIPEDKATQIEAAVNTQMATDEVKKTISEALEKQIETLVAENLASEAVQAKLKQSVTTAQTAIDSLTGLKAQLDQVNSFVTGLAAYTEGVSQAQAGSVTLHAGATGLASGATELSNGVTTLSAGAVKLATGTSGLSEGAAQLKTGMHDAVNTAADQLLPYLQDQVVKYIEVFNQTRESTHGSTGYDLAAEGTASETVYIIRTDLK